MPPDSQRCILRGFSDELDWKAVHFVNRLPPSQVCSACGLVVRRTGSLTCGHFLCGPCCEQLREPAGTPLCCPFDGEACSEESVRWRDFSAESLLERRVYCWNKANGCSVIVSASDLHRHFYHECTHHAVSCPKCSTKVLCNSLCLHLRSCSGGQEPYVTESAQGAGDHQQSTEVADLKAMLSTAAQQVKEQLLEVKGRLEVLSLDGSLQMEQVSSLSHTMNSLKELQSDQGNVLSRTMNDLKQTLQRDLERGANRTRDGISRVAADIGAVRNRLSETGRETFREMNTLLRHSLRTQSTHHWILKGYRSLKAKARRMGSADRYSSPVYLCHYLISQGVCFERDCDDLLLSMKICVKKGELDEYLEWPFQKRMVLCVVHPETYERKEIQLLPELGDDRYARPTASCNETVHSSDTLYLTDLERDGYLRGNELELCFELT